MKKLLKDKKTLPVFVLLLLASFPSGATTVVFVVSSSGIFVGADSKQLRKGNQVSGVCNISERIDKTVVVQDRFVVATLDLVAIDRRHRVTGEKIYYDFTKLVSQINEKCPRDASVLSLARIVKMESRIALQKVDKLIANGAVSRDNSDPLIEYAVAGYDNGVPTIVSMHYSVDWKNLRLKEAFIAPIHPNTNKGIDRNLHALGWADAVIALKQGKGEGYKDIASTIPNELPKLIAGNDLSLGEATNVCLSILRWENKHHPQFVGPPYLLKIIPPLGMGGIREQTYQQ